MTEPDRALLDSLPWPAAMAVRLRRRGVPWDEIAEVVDYVDGACASNSTYAALKRRDRLDVWDVIRIRPGSRPRGQ